MSYRIIIINLNVTYNLSLNLNTVPKYIWYKSVKVSETKHFTLNGTIQKVVCSVAIQISIGTAGENNVRSNYVISCLASSA